jgi:hypothetical protein
LLVGIPPGDVRAGSIFRVAGSTARVVVQERRGLIAVGQMRGQLQPGMTLQA